MIRTLAYGLIIAVCAFASVIGSELLVVEWLKVAPFDVTASIFLTAVVPVHLVVQGLIISVIAPLLRRKAWLFIGLYLAVALGFYVTMLSAFANPMADIIRYELSTIVTVALWLLVNRGRVFKQVPA